MTGPQTMQAIRFNLLFSAVGLLPIALSYGIDPNQILSKLLQIQPVQPGVVSIFRSVMGLYLASIVLWLLGAIRSGPLMRTALIGEIVFMAGLAAGRPSLMLIACTVSELLLAAWGVFCLKRFDILQGLTNS
jgi:hypothetical protein